MAASNLPHPLSTPRLFWILLILTVTWFTLLGSRRLIEPDEGRYAEIAREMLTTGDWLTPRLSGIKYFEKPPLQYWMTASAYRLFGQNEFAARFWTGLTGFAGILLAWFAGTRLFGRNAGWMAACILASSLLYAVIGQINTLDMGLSFFLQAAVLGFLLAQQTPPRSAAEHGWMLVAWAAAALAFLSKGLVALVLPGLALAIHTAVTRDFAAWKRLRPLSGLPLFLALAAPWVIAVSRANPEFADFFFFHEQLQRFLTTIHDRDAPWWYFLALLAAGALPWTTLLPQAMRDAWRADRGRPFQSRRFLMFYVTAVVVFFSLSHSKLPPYIVPALPAIALVAGDALTRVRAASLRIHLLVMASLAFAIGIAAVLVPATIAGAKSIDVVNDLRPETASAFLLIACALLAATRMLRKYSVEIAVTTAGVGTVLGLGVLLYGSDALRATRSGYDLAQQLAPKISAQTKLYSIGLYKQTLPFYLRRTLTPVGYRGEFDFGLRQEPALGLADVNVFLNEWRRQPHAIALLSPALFEQLSNYNVPMKAIAKQHDLVAVATP